MKLIEHRFCAPDAIPAGAEVVTDPARVADVRAALLCDYALAVERGKTPDRPVCAKVQIDKICFRVAFFARGRVPTGAEVISAGVVPSPEADFYARIYRETLSWQERHGPTRQRTVLYSVPVRTP